MPTEQDREAEAHRPQQAAGDGRSTLGEFTDRPDVVLAAESAAQLRAVLDDLPTAAPVVGTAAPTSFGVFGDLRVRSSPPRRRSDRSRHRR